MMSTLATPRPTSRRTSTAAKKLPRMTEEEFVAWAMADEDRDAEWVDGEVILMPPISDVHDLLQGWFRAFLEAYVDRKQLGHVRGPQFTVRFAKLRRRREPDVLFVSKARSGILRRNHVEGAPDLTIEIVSPESVARDWREKFLEYAAAGVKEYWVVDPAQRVVEVYVLVRGRRTYRKLEEVDGKLASTVVPGWYVKPAWLWAERRPNVLDVLAETGVR